MFIGNYIVQCSAATPFRDAHSPAGLAVPKGDAT